VKPTCGRRFAAPVPNAGSLQHPFTACAVSHINGSTQAVLHPANRAGSGPFAQRGEVAPMRIRRLRDGRSSPALRYRRQSCRLQNPANRRSAHAMADVRERALDSRVPPRRILRRHAHDHELTDLEQYTSLSGFPGVQPLSSDQLTMPPQPRVRRGDCRDSRRAARPSRYALAASRRSSSVRRRCRLPSCCRKSRSLRSGTRSPRAPAGPVNQ
jgi:hypothetical protein